MRFYSYIFSAVLVLQASLFYALPIAVMRFFPAAALKIFLTASAEERARRRYNQLKDKGLSVSLADLSREIAERDHRDASRTLAPLVAAADAITLDSTGLTPDEVVARVLELARDRHVG